MWGTSGGSITKWGKKLYFYPVRLFRTIDKVVPKTALFTSHLVFGFIGWSIKMSKCCQNCTYPHSVCIGDHFVGQSLSFACCIGDYLVDHSQSFPKIALTLPVQGSFVGPLSEFCQKLHVSSLCLYSRPFGGPLAKLSQKLHFLYSGPIGGPLSKWCRKLHFSSLCLYSGPFGGPLKKWCQKLHFSSLCLYRGPFGGPLSKFCQKLHFSSLCLYRGPFGGPQSKFCRKLHFSLNAVNIKGPSGPFIK